MPVIIDGTLGVNAAAVTTTSWNPTNLSIPGNSTIGDASSDTLTINSTVQPGVVISGTSSSDALRITQIGSGNALLVEDSTNPDSTPFVVASDGKVGVGTLSPSTSLDVAGGIRISGPLQSQTFFNGTATTSAYIGQLTQNTDYDNATSSSVPTFGNVCSITGTASSTGTASITGHYALVNGAGTTSSSPITLNAGTFIASRSSSSDVSTSGTLYGVLGTTRHLAGANSAMSTTNAYSVYAQTNIGAGVAVNTYGVTSQGYLGATTTSSASSTNRYGLHTAFTVGAASSNTATLTNYYDAYLSGVTVAATGTVTNKYGLYQAGADHNNYFAGKVGIGTTSPSGTLHVAVTGGGAYFNTAGGIPRLYLGGGNGFGFNRIQGGEDVFFGEPGDTGTWRVRGAGTISLGVGDSATTMTIAGNGGNVGIGTAGVTSVTSKLTLARLMDANEWNAFTIANAGSWSVYPNSISRINFTDGAGTVGTIGVGFNGQGFLTIGNFYTSNYGTSGEIMRVNGTGSVVFPKGQLQFPASQNASSDPNTLDDYEEGTHTTTVTVGSGSVTSYTSRTLQYVKIGRQVTIWGRLHVNLSATNVTSFKFTLPFALAYGNGGSDEAEIATVAQVIRATANTGTSGAGPDGIRIFRGISSTSTMTMQTADGGETGNFGVTNPHINFQFSYYTTA